MASLNKYKQLRSHGSPEPDAVVVRPHKRLRFVVQKHWASHLHYDFRLEVDGVLKSWALPKGPSLDPKQRRLAIRVEDHPYAYGRFEGTIPEGHYGAGEVVVWDRGTYRSSKGGSEAVAAGLRKGALSIVLRGRKLRGTYALVRLKRPRQWLLIKKKDEFSSVRDVTRDIHSVKTRRPLLDVKPKRRCR
jgi:bifunctional non-homologous end joining protein LigD